MKIYKINQPITVCYKEEKGITGIDDIVLTPTNPSGVDQDPITMTEVGNGMYKASFTPNCIGRWWVRISCSSKPKNCFAQSYFIEYQEATPTLLKDPITGYYAHIKRRKYYECWV